MEPYLAKIWNNEVLTVYINMWNILYLLSGF